MLKRLSLTVLSTVLFFLLAASSFGQITGTGCNLGRTVATQYLGTAIYNGSAGQYVRVYSSSSASRITIITGNGYAGYRCGYINVYPAGSKYVSESQPNKAYNAAEEITSTSSTRCAIADSFSANFTSSQTGGGEGTEIGYKYNDPAQYSNADPNYPCANQPNNLPIDDYMPYLLGLIGFFGCMLIRNRVFLPTI